MSEVVVVADPLRLKVAEALHEMAIRYPRSSIAGDVKVEFWNDVCAAVCEIIDINFSDFESSLIVACARVKERVLPHAFVKRKSKPNPPTIWKKRS